jgi:transcriptional regulator with XRE-family HTH domain
MYETSKDVLDALRIKLRLHSDRAIARALDLTPATVNFWRQGKTNMSPAVAIKAAELLEIPPETLLLQRYVEAEKDPKARAVLSSIAAKMHAAIKKSTHAAAIATLAIAGILGVSAPPPSHAASSADASSVYYVLSEISEFTALCWNCRSPPQAWGGWPPSTIPASRAISRRTPPQSSAQHRAPSCDKSGFSPSAPIFP